MTVGDIISYGKGHNKKLAKRAAAKSVLAILNGKASGGGSDGEKAAAENGKKPVAPNKINKNATLSTTLHVSWQKA